MREKSMFEQLYDGIADAVSDIREKVVEEGWFGRSLSEGQGHESERPHWPDAREPGSHARDVEREFGRNTPDLDIDR